MHNRIEQGFSLDGRVAVVTGAAAGIGRESALLLAQAGAHVVIADLDEEGLAQSAEQIGDRVTVVKTNVAERAAVDQLAAAALAVSGRIDIWVNVAGIITPFDIIDADETMLDNIIAVNLKGVYWGCAAAGKIMKENGGGGSIINMSSTGADSAPAGLSGYALTKAGVNSLTRTAAREFGAFGVRVNAVAPGSVETAMTTRHYQLPDGSIDEKRREEVLAPRRAASPLGITGETLDIAYTVLYLAGDASRFVTGQVLRTNGGATMP